MDCQAYHIKVFLIILMLAFLSSNTRGQTTFQMHYGSTSAEVCNDLIITADSGYVMAGYATNIGAGSIDMCLVKIDKTGNQEWAVNYGGITQEMVRSVAETQDGGYILCGYTNSFSVGYDDVYLIKTDNKGSVIWARSYGGPTTERGNDVVATSDGGYAVVGGTYFGGASSDAFLLKVDSLGNQEFMKMYGGTGFDEAYSIITLSNGGFGILGASTSFGAGGEDFYFIKTDDTGEITWSRTYGGDAWDRGASLVQTFDGGYVLTGHTESFTLTKHSILQCYILKVDSFGIPEWSKAVGKINSENVAYDIIQTVDSGYCLVGYSSHFTGPYQGYIVKTDKLGNYEWSKTGGSGSLNYLNAVAQTYDQGFVVGGFSNGLGGQSDFWLARTDDVGFNKCNSSDSITLIHDTLPFMTIPADTAISGAFSDTSAVIQTNVSLNESLLCNNLCNTEAEFPFDDSIFCQGDTVQLSGNISGAGNPQWYLDGQPYAYVADTFYVADSLGSFDIVFIASEQACSDSVTHSITITDTVLSDFSYVIDNLTVSFSEQSSFAENWVWYFGTGDIDSANNPVYTYPDTGTFTACLVSSNDCNSDSICNDIHIDCPYPEAIFTFTTDDLFVNFDNNSIYGGTFYWIFGDGNSSTDTNAIHTYGESGTYQVCLSATNNCGSNISCEDVTVVEPTPGLVEFNLTNASIFIDAVSKEIVLNLNYPVQGRLELDLRNSLGQKINIRYAQSPQRTQYVVSTVSLSRGLYFLTLSDDTRSISFKIVL